MPPIEPDIASAILDLHLNGLMEKLRPLVKSELSNRDWNDDELRSLAFVVRCVQVELELDEIEGVLECITDGGSDLAVDAIKYGSLDANTLNVDIFQCKYQRYENAGEKNFPENEITKLIQTIGLIFDPYKTLPKANPKLQAKAEEIRSLIKSGSYFPYIRVFACNNGKKWTDSAQTLIDNFGRKDSIEWHYINQDVLYNKTARKKSLNETLRLEGDMFIEKKDFREICVGRIPVIEIARIMQEHGDALLERNIRRFLGFRKNRVNSDIKDTLLKNPKDFYYYNNGVTIICAGLDYNELQKSNHAVRLTDMNIINGGQTCMTILKTAEELNEKGEKLSSDASVLVRIYKLGTDERDEIINRITLATNSQNPVDLKDLRSNDEIQKQIEKNIGQQSEYKYIRNRGSGTGSPREITSATAAQAVMAVWRKKPDIAKFRETELFGPKYYTEIFDNKINAVQIICAVLLFRLAENRRKRPKETDPQHIYYSSAFVAMCMGQYLLKELGIQLSDLSHAQGIDQKAFALIESNQESWVEAAIQKVSKVLNEAYQSKDIDTLQKLSAKFRRSDLIDYFKD